MTDTLTRQIRIFTRKSLENWKIIRIFAAVNINKVSIKVYLIYKYHFDEY